MPPLPRGLVVPVAPAGRVVPALLQGLRARVVATGAWIVARRSRYRTTRHTLKARIVRQDRAATRTTRRSCRCFGRRRYFRICPERQVWKSSRSSRRSSRNAPRETSAHGEGSEAPQGHKRQGRRDSEESSKHAKPKQLQIDYIVTRSKMPEVQGLWNQGATHGSNEMANMSEARHNEMTNMSEAMSCYDGSTHPTQTYA